MSGLLVEIGDGCLYLSGDGRCTDILKNDSIAKLNRPPSHGWCDTSHISIYEGTDLCQWYGRCADGRFHPHGKIMRLTEDGRKLVEDVKRLRE